ncbi:putative sugar O-methyltransferase [uncultured Roseibium sp.]|uniref:putative sugar O-methyltransferase n=1 Tax=uncultured Roseibium sp. TaxID=1936171 RepID=UPI00261E4DAE|nr:putative sugar O-methyltransferase [uncultured Roseibium sp.]
MKDEPELLKLMMDDMSVQASIHRPGPYWQRYANTTVDAILRHGVACFRNNPEVGKGYSDVPLSRNLSPILPATGPLVSLLKSRFGENVLRRFSNGSYEYLSRLALQRHFDRELGSFLRETARNSPLPDTMHGDPARWYRIAGRKIGFNYIRVFSWIADFEPVVDFGKVKAVLEIGGGSGAYAHTLLHRYPNIERYYYLDIPPTLYVGTQYLKHFFPGDVFDYRETRSLETITPGNTAGKRIIPLCPWQLEKVEDSIDFFWNSSSFQEMGIAIVSNYIRQAERLANENGTSKFGIFTYATPKTETPVKKKKRLLPKSEIVNTFENGNCWSCHEVAQAVSKKLISGELLCFERTGAGPRPPLP